MARSASAYLKEVEDHFAVRIQRIAIDAPSNPRSPGVVLREAERGLSTRGMSYFQTPDEVEIAAMTTMARRHLADGGPVTHLPHGNRLWMLLGFELFSRLRQEGWECLEVFPQAIAVSLGAAAIHKSKTDGLARQLNAVATFTGWPVVRSPSSLEDIAYGSSDDKLDAYLSAWVASLDTNAREAIGAPPDDAIWIPRV